MSKRIKTAADIQRLREISARLKELDIPEETLVELNNWIDTEETKVEQAEPHE